MRSKLEAELTIRKHWKLSAAFTGSLHPGRGKKLTETELLPGELSAELFQVGCYTVRSAKRVYQVCEPGYSPEEERPASPEDVALVRKDMPPEIADPRLSFIMAHSVCFQSWRDRLRVTHEISAKHQSSLDGSFTVICRAAESRSYTWSETIGMICVAKEHIAIPNGHASLFVCNTYMGDSFTADTWYKLDPTGKITTLSLHPYNSDIDKARFT